MSEASPSRTGEHYDIRAVASRNPVVRHLRDDIRHILLESDTCWPQMEPYVLPPGVEGSTQFDHMAAVNVLRKHDMQGLLTGVPGASLWRELVKVLRAIGFNVRNGRVNGLLEYDQQNDAEPQQPKAQVA